MTSFTTKRIAEEPTQRLQMWGFVWLSCYGLFTGFLLVLTTGNPFAILAFGLMGLTYWSVFQLYKWRGRAAFEGWETAEIAFGVISFVGLTL